jgi:hypothetical protein
MTIIAFGKGDLLSLPFLFPRSNSFGSETAYTNPTYDRFYSKHGFAVPLDYEGIPYEFLVERDLLVAGELSKHAQSYGYLVIDHRGRLWKNLIIDTGGINPEKPEVEITPPVYSPQFIFSDTGTWWMTSNGSTDDTGYNALFGLLKTNPNIDDIDTYWSRCFLGKRRVWLSITEIVKTLNEKYPLVNIASGK